MSTADPARRGLSDPAEAIPLAQEMHAALARLVGQFKRSMGLSISEALAQAEEVAAGQQGWALQVPPERVTWLDLHVLAERDPEAMARRWEEIRRAAVYELRSGQRAARALCDSSPFERAQFLALRDELARQWRPQGAVEVQLIEVMALAQSETLCWLAALSRWSTMGAEASGRDARDEAGRATPRLTEAEAIDRAAAKVDLFNRIFLRALRALSDLRRHAPTVVVQNAGQVNVGGQQVNVAPS
jgi:hypothetical protein